MSQQYYTIEPLSNSFTSSQPEASISNNIQLDSGLNSNWKYRQYMQQNANHIMKYNTMSSIYSSGNNPYIMSNNLPTNKSPFLFSSVHDTSSPAYGLHNSDLKMDYMTKERMNARMIAPTISTNF
jgi:hypothetical protein